jgi:hypothetical protein
LELLFSALARKNSYYSPVWRVSWKNYPHPWLHPNPWTCWTLWSTVNWKKALLTSCLHSTVYTVKCDWPLPNNC